MEEDDVIQYHRDQDDEPMHEDRGASQNELTFAQQKAELKRKILAQPPKR